ncbi:YihY/virulence factor BrkB family protein [Staphylococcus simiae]|uniref:YihY/virulence factor BrkB family protein n=1 Tax=Staphylococcus simiae TaxID=308354 RepID=UPI001A9598C7|nr:YihY/virulence factor BrkB family protein [Staphylococcus simiae]MBO1199481.1 YihY/virulence factor BrkB family protein [Staphylococcus simiae]MBO1201913.1 YihY/virulence factor BrkB family protein [Staphylococcus simiae]MBO1203977.1 YihY/virulence factor BrkB family protein [Staphylococcus simiae]MBO1211489.1 YihY/virulence factor BrkB family protein [Staphylococcus simiae]MBO1230362.1 YihY/virulence factor BrkB family protein [Staphylococcus simiae]
MSKKDATSSKFLNSIKNGQDDHNDKKSSSSKIKVDRTYVEPQQFQSKDTKKDDQVLFVSRLNKPAKYKKDSNFLSYLIYRIGKDDASGLAAQMTYHFVLALFPMLIFLLTLLPFFNIKQSQITEMLSNAPADTSTLIKGVINDVTQNSSGGLLSVGLILAIWSASNGMTAIMNSFNVAYDVEDSRNGIVLKLLSVLFTIVMGVVFVVALALPTLGSVISHFLFGPLGLDDEVRWIFNLIRIGLPIIIIFIVFIVLYSVAPNVKTKIKSVLPGAIFTSVIWLVGSFGFGWYISNFGNYSKTYGSIAGIIILLLWLYITSFIIIVGAEINAIIHQRNVIKGKTPEEAALQHDDNNQNHYNEDTKYQYNNDANNTHNKEYHIDKHPDDEYPEDDKNIAEKVIDKFKKD